MSHASSRTSDGKQITVISCFTDPRFGGPQRRALSVAIKLQSRGIETVFLIPDATDDFADAVNAEGLRVHRLSSHQIRPPTDLTGNIRYLGSIPGEVRRIKNIIYGENADIVHASRPVDYQAGLAASLSGVPLVWHFNDTSMPAPVRQLSARAANQLADEIIVVADAVREYYFSGGHRSRTVYTPVNLEEFNPDKTDSLTNRLHTELGLPTDVPVVGAVGNINPAKGYRELLYAVAKLVNETEVIVPIVGKPLETQRTYHQELLALRSELGLEDQVRFLGRRSDIPALLSLFDILVLPSVSEACPTVTLEAMAMKTPVVATDVGGVREQIPNENYGWVVPSESPCSLAEAISDALMHPSKRRDRAQCARKRVEKMFSLERCVTTHEEIYRSLV